MLTAEQIEMRRSGIGGSDAAAVCGQHPTKGPADVWMSKLYPESDTDAGPRAEAGNRFEGVIAQWASDTIGVALLPPVPTLRHPTRPWMLANLDGRLADGRILEVKMLDAFRSRRLDEGDGQEPLLEHLYQVQHYMEVDDSDGSVVAYLVGGNDLRIFEVARDREWAALIVEQEERFWRENVLARVCPTVGSGASVARALSLRYPRERDGLIATTAPEVIALAMAVAHARAVAKAADAAAEDAKAALEGAIGDALGFDFGALGKATWKANKDSRPTDWKALAAHLGATPETIAKFTTTKPGARVLRVSLTGSTEE